MYGLISGLNLSRLIMPLLKRTKLLELVKFRIVRGSRAEVRFIRTSRKSPVTGLIVDVRIGITVDVRKRVISDVRIRIVVDVRTGAGVGIRTAKY